MKIRGENWDGPIDYQFHQYTNVAKQILKVMETLIDTSVVVLVRGVA